MVFAIVAFERKVGTGQILGGNQANAQSAQVRMAGKVRHIQDFRPGINGIAGEGGVGVGAAVDRCDVENIAETIEGECAGDAEHVAAIDDAAAKAALFFP